MQFGDSFFGMSIEEVRATAGSMDAQAARIEATLSRLARLLSSTAWTGPDADRFRSDWSSVHAPRIRKAAQDVRSSAGKVRTQIETQIRVSSR
jgi:uncharacterized protein YukE